MTPKIKAQELVDKLGGFSIGESKSNAIVCVDEIIASLNQLNPRDMKVIYQVKFCEWVKQEIQKL